MLRCTANKVSTDHNLNFQLKHPAMAKRMVKDLAIEEALQEEIKDTLDHNIQSYDEWCAQTDEGKNNTSFSWPYMLISMI